MKSKKTLIIAIVAIIVALGGTFAGLWFFTNVFDFLKPANDAFVDQAEKVLNLEGVKFENYSSVLEEYKEMSDKSTKATLNLSANLDLDDLEDDVEEVINKSKLSLELNSDAKNKKFQTKVGLYADTSEVLTLDVVANGDKLGIGSKDLYDKYLTVTMDDIIELLEDAGEKEAAEMLEKLMSSSSSANIDMYELLYISEDDLKHFDETYRDCFKNLIPKDCYKTESGVEVKVDGKNTKTTAYYLTLTGKDLYKFISDFAKLIQDDEVITKILTEKANLILEAASQEKVSEKDVDALIDELVEELLSNLENMKEDEDTAVQIVIYSTKLKPVRIEFNMVEDDDAETLISAEFAKEKNIFKLYNGKDVIGSLVNKYSKNSKEEKVGSFELEVSGETLGKLNYDLLLKDNEMKIKADLEVEEAELKASIDFSSKGNLNKEAVNYDGSFKFEFEGQSIEVKMDGSMEYGNVSIPELTKSNSVNVLDLSEKELQEELMKILEKASKVLPERLELLGFDIDADDIFPSNKTPNVQTKPNTTTTNTTSTTNTTNKINASTIKKEAE